MVQAASVKVGLELDTAQFESGAARARRVFNEQLSGIQAATRQTADAMGNLSRAANIMAGAFAVDVGVRGVVEMGKALVMAGDSAQQLRAKLEASVGGGAEAYNQARIAADKLGVSTQAVAGTMARLGFATQGLGYTKEQLLAITETMARLGAIGGSSTAEINSGLQQLSQGMAKGRLDGDELRSVLENIPGSVRLLAEAMGVSIGAVRDMGAAGKITADVMIKAFGDAGGEIQRMFEGLPPNFDRVLTTLENQFQQFLLNLDTYAGSSNTAKNFFKAWSDAIAQLNAKLGLGEVQPGGGDVGRQGVELALQQNRDKIGQLQLGLGRATQEGNTEEINQYNAAIRDLVAVQAQLQNQLNSTNEKLRQQRDFVVNIREQVQMDRDRGPVAKPDPFNKPGMAIYPEPPGGSTQGVANDLKAAQADYNKFIKPLDQDLEAIGKKRVAEAEKLANANKRTAESNEKLLAQSKAATAAAQAEYEAISLGEDARARANVQKEYEAELNKAAEAGNEKIAAALREEARLRRDVGMAGVEQARLIKDAQAKIDASPGGVGGHGFYGETSEEAEKARKQLLAQGKLSPEEQAAASRKAQMMTQPWLDLASRVSAITSDMFEEMLDKGTISFQKLADGVADMFKTTIAGTIGNVVQQPLLEMADKFGKGEFDWGKMSYGQKMGTSAAAGGAGGYVAGSVYGQLTGKEDTYAGVGGGIGGAIGGAAGFAATGTPMGAAAGATLGAMAGSFIGGFFGGEGLGNDQSVQKFGTAVARVVWSDKSFSPENRQVTGGIASTLGDLQEKLTQFGATIGSTQITLQAGNKSGIMVQGKGYEDAGTAQVAAIRLLLQQTTGLSTSQQTALRTTKARTGDEVMKDLAFAQEFDKIVFSGTAAEAAMRDLTDRFDATAQEARRLGLDESALAAARIRAMDQMTQAVARQARDLGAQFQMITASGDLQKQLVSINQSFAVATDQFKDAGYSAENLAAVEAARIAAEGQARQQQAQADQQAAAAAAAERQAAKERAAAEAEQRRAAARAAAQEREQARQRARDVQAQYGSAVAKGDLERQIIGINQQFAQLADQMKEVGYNAAGFRNIERARQQAIRDAQEQDRRRVRETLSQYSSAISTTDIERTLIGINQQFSQLRDTMVDAGYNAEGFRRVELARQRAVAEAYEQDRRQKRDVAAEYMNAVTTSELERTLRGIELQFTHLSETLRDAGWSAGALAEVERARWRANEEAIQQQIRQVQDNRRSIEQQTRGVRDYFDGLIAPLREAANDNSALNPMTKIQQALAKFREDVGGAQSGDVRSLQAVAGSAGTLRGLVDQNMSTGGYGAAIRREIAASTRGLAEDLESQRDRALASLPDVQRETTADVIKAMRLGIDDLLASNAKLLDELHRQGRRA